MGKTVMIDWKKEPARVSRARAKELLAIKDDKLFAKVVQAKPELVHRLPGETRAHYRTGVIMELMEGE